MWGSYRRYDGRVPDLVTRVPSCGSTGDASRQPLSDAGTGSIPPASRFPPRPSTRLTSGAPAIIAPDHSLEVRPDGERSTSSPITSTWQSWPGSACARSASGGAAASATRSRAVVPTVHRARHRDSSNGPRPHRAARTRRHRQRQQHPLPLRPVPYRGHGRRIRTSSAPAHRKRRLPRLGAPRGDGRARDSSGRKPIIGVRTCERRFWGDFSERAFS